MTAITLRGDARQLPLPDASVDLIVTSPPYYALRDYRDGAASLGGQIGSEPTPQAYLEALWEGTAEWARVLKPQGSMFVVLGDKYSDRTGGLHRGTGTGRGPQAGRLPQSRGPMEKSLLLLPHRYAIGCVDRLGLILRQDQVWEKANGLPESVTDRTRRSHEYLFHLVKQPRYYSAVDEVRERTDPAVDRHVAKYNGREYGKTNVARADLGASNFIGNPLGKLPGSVWTLATEPLTVPPWRGVLAGRTVAWFPTWPAAAKWARAMGTRAGRPSIRPEVDHFAAFPSELVRRIVLGWSPAGVCTACGEGRWPVIQTRPIDGWNRRTVSSRNREGSGHGGGSEEVGTFVVRNSATKITGYACACTPYIDHPERRGQSWHDHSTDAVHGKSRRAGQQDSPPSLPVQEYHFDRWTPPPTRPSVVLDPFSGTGTTVHVAAALGRTGIGVDLSHAYSRLARCPQLAQARRGKVRGRTAAEAQYDLLAAEVTA